MNLNQLHSIYFVGIGGIGMSALARYFHAMGVRVAGYDRVRSPLCQQLEQEGMEIAYTDDPAALPAWFLEAPLVQAAVVYTPAVPASHAGLAYLRSKGYGVMKRSEMLGNLTEGKRTVAVAGTHGKTSTSALVTHLLRAGGIPCTAFLGGIATNLASNVWIEPEADIVVVEADEYDRSFLRLNPEVAVITSVEADHLDIYETGDALLEAFQAFAKKVSHAGLLLCRKGIDMESSARLAHYGIDAVAEVSATNIEVREGKFTFEVTAFGHPLGRMAWNFAGRHNVENALAAIGVALEMGVKPEDIAAGMASFTGVKRRFEVHVQRDDCVYIDDYAHHPSEIDACIGSARELYPDRRITGVFQPHLYSRTRDFGDAFARSLEALNELLLLDIYPARELPIPDIDSDWLLRKIELVNKKLCAREEVVDEVLSLAPEVLLTMGAGDIDALVQPLKDALDGKKDE